MPEFKNTQWPKITIVTPSYNQGQFLEKTIRSVLLQEYPNLEYVIIDGGSTDNSVEIIEKYESQLTYWVSEKDRGQSHAINKGFERATGELLGWLNSDDWYTEGALFKLASEYMKDKSAGAIYGQGHILEPSGNLYETKLSQVSTENLFEWFAGGAEFMQPSCLFTHQAWLECGPLVEDIHYAMDLDLWIKISKKFRFKRIEDLLSISFKHDDAKTSAFAEFSLIDVAIVYMRHGRQEKARKALENQIKHFQKHINELENKIENLQSHKSKYRFLKQFPLLNKILDYLR